MVFPRRIRPGHRRRTYWFFSRFDVLVMEGFTPEESALIANVRISSGPVRRLRRVRKRMVQNAINAGMTREEAIELVRAEIRGTELEVISWDDFRRFVYGRIPAFGVAG